jgi:hypothetical protein
MLKRLQSFFSAINNLRYASLIYAAVLAVIAAAVLGYAFLTRKPVQVQNGPIRFVSSKCEALEKDCLSLRKQLADADKNALQPYSEAQLAIAGKLLTAHDKWLGDCANSVKLDNYYDTLRVRYETTCAQKLASVADESQKTGEDALAKGDYNAARRYLSLALSAQSSINETYPSARQADVNRKEAIGRLLMDATYKPMLVAYQAIKDEADAAFDRADYETSRARYVALVSEIKRISVDIPQNYMSFDEQSFTAERRLMESAARIKGRELDKVVAEAEKAVAAKDWKTAQTLYANAVVIQNAIALNFPDSTLAAKGNVSALEKKRQNDLSLEYSDALDESLGGIGRAVKARDAGRLHGLTVQAQANLAALRKTYPDSNLLKSEQVVRLQFLISNQPDLIDIRDTIVTHVLKTVGNSDWRMLDREVWQLLYAKLMGSNPSVRKADTLPVEGVTMEEAREFARRLSWVIDDEVRIPEADAYLALMQPADLNFIRKYAWNSVTSPNKETQPVATSKADALGYYDLYGNASEWAEPLYSGSSVAVVIGGSARDNPARLSEIPQEKHPVTERVRNAGFRVMVRFSK